jgi:PAS domain S-box-containing protein
MKVRLAGALVDGGWAQNFALAFLVWSTLWIVISDAVLGALVRSHTSFWMLQTEKGLIYALVSAIILLWALRRFEKDQANLRIVNEQRLRSLKDSGLIGVVGTTADGRITDVNWILGEMLGTNQAELIHTTADRLIAPEYEGDWKRAQEVFSQHGRTGLFRCDLLHKDGKRVPVIGGKARIGEEGESIIYFLDVSPLVKSEEERLKLQVQLLEAEKMSALGQLASGVAHNFNNELSIIVGYGAVLHEHLAADTTSSRHIQKVLESAERSRKLIQRLLAFSRKQPVHPEVIDVNAVLSELQPSIRRILPPTIELRLEVSHEPLSIRVDPTQLVQVLLNLVNNSADAMPQGGILLLASSAEFSKERPTVTIEVTDNGVGMDDKTAQRIFEPFFTTKSDLGGTGLGLSTAYGMVQQNGGQIEVISRPQLGTTFKVTFSKYESVSPIAAQPSAAITRSIHGSVLLVEDRDDLRELMAQVLSSSGLEVIAARDGIEAIKASESRDIDIILSDVVMPRLNGPEAVRVIRETHPDVKVVYVSGSADLIEPNGRDVVMWKPVKPQALLAIIRSCLAGDGKSFNSMVA